MTHAIELPYSDGIIGHMEFFTGGDAIECLICWEQIAANEPRVAHETCKKLFHPKCLLGWAMDAGNGNPACPNDRQLLLSEHWNDDLRFGGPQHLDLVMRLEELTWRDYGTWSHGRKFIRNSRGQSSSVSGPPIDIHGNARSSFDLNKDISLTNCVAEIIVMPQFPQSLFCAGGRDIDWLCERLRNGNSNHASETPKDSGWRMLQYQDWNHRGENEGTRMFQFLAYVAPERREEERQARDALYEWKRLKARDQAAEDPEIPTWRLTDYDEAWLTYCFNHRDNPHVDLDRKHFHKHERSLQVDVWEQEFVLGEHTLMALSEDDIFGVGRLTGWELAEAFSLLSAWTEEPSRIVKIEERESGSEKVTWYWVASVR